jgi:hypothetical protein
MIQLEFGDALRRLRDGEALILTCLNQPRFQVVILDARGLWALRAEGWVLLNDPLNLIMTATWYKDPDQRYIPLPIGPAPKSKDPKS